MKKRVIAVLISAILLYQPLSVSAAAAPDGMTDASKTPAAQNGGMGCMVWGMGNNKNRLDTGRHVTWIR